MLRQNFGQEPLNEQVRISESEMRSIIELYDQQIGIATSRTSAAPRLDSTTEKPTLADVAELLGITPVEAQNLLQEARKQKAAQNARVASLKTVPPPPVSAFSPQQQVTVVQNVIVDSHAHLFQRFDENNGEFLATWNWGAFWFGPLWYLYKGMWIKAMLYFVLSVIAALLTVGGGGLLFSIALGIIGNYDYYLLRCHGTQVWDKRRQYTTVTRTYQTSASRIPVATPAAQVAAAEPATTENLDQTAHKLQLLRDAFDRGLLTADEFEEKRYALLNEIENQANLKTLAEAHRAGLLTDAEYYEKRQALLGR